MPVTIGVDPHKASHTAAAVDEHGQLLDQRHIPATLEGYQLLRQWAECWPQRCWAVEGAHGIGRAVAQWLVANNERVVDVPAKLTPTTRSRSRSPPAAPPPCGRSAWRTRRLCCTC
jgi:transposase